MNNHPYVVYQDPETSEITKEYDTLDDALSDNSLMFALGSELIQNGVTVATYTIDGWKLA